MLRDYPGKQPLTEIEYNFSSTWLNWFTSVKQIINHIWTRLSGYLYNYHNPVRITNSDSPFTVTEGQYKIIADTDSGAVTINLPNIPFNHGFLIKNTGSSGNNITLSASDSIEDSTVYDGESADLVGDSTDGWVWT